MANVDIEWPLQVNKYNKKAQTHAYIVFEFKFYKIYEKKKLNLREYFSYVSASLSEHILEFGWVRYLIV